MFYSILLLQAAVSQEPGELGCGETCRNVTVPYPFGIKDVTCNDGENPFISRINLELLDSFSQTASLSTVSNKDKNRTAASVNLTGSPFYFSSRFNVFGCVGCGNLASIFRNQTDPIGGCLEPRCGDETSKGGCYTIISENQDERDLSS
ncbi:Wall-associated receptor kinase [Theobroma cacao]|nr:Wall-associated receptor kinase [Theobroma cacao]